MVDAQPVAKDALQALHNLHRQGNLGQQIEHLLLPLQRLLYQVDVYLCLARTCHTVQQGDVLLHHLHQDGIVGILLGFSQRFDELWTIVASMVQTTHLHFIGFQQLPFLQLADGFCRRLRGIHQFLPGHLNNLQTWIIVLDEVPVRQFQIAGKRLQLLLRASQDVQGDVQSSHMAILLCQPDVRLRLGFVAVLRLQSAGQCRLVHLTDGRQVVVANPMPQLQLLWCDHRLLVYLLLNGFHFVALRLHMMHPGYQTDICLRPSEAHQHAHALTYRHALRHGVGKQPLQRNGQYHVGIHHP